MYRSKSKSNNSNMINRPNRSAKRRAANMHANRLLFSAVRRLLPQKNAWPKTALPCSTASDGTTATFAPSSSSMTLMLPTSRTAPPPATAKKDKKNDGDSGTGTTVDFVVHTPAVNGGYSWSSSSSSSNGGRPSSGRLPPPAPVKKTTEIATATVDDDVKDIAEDGTILDAGTIVASAAGPAVFGGDVDVVEEQRDDCETSRPRPSEDISANDDDVAAGIIAPDEDSPAIEACGLPNLDAVFLQSSVAREAVKRVEDAEKEVADGDDDDENEQQQAALALLRQEADAAKQLLEEYVERHDKSFKDLGDAGLGLFWKHAFAHFVELSKKYTDDAQQDMRELKDLYDEVRGLEQEAFDFHLGELNEQHDGALQKLARAEKKAETYVRLAVIAGAFGVTVAAASAAIAFSSF